MWPQRDRYLALAARAGTRLELVEGGGEQGPGERPWRPDMLFVDGSHDRDLTIATFRAWRPSLERGAIVAFHDYENPEYPGVTEAIRALDLDGEPDGDVYVWRAG